MVVNKAVHGSTTILTSGPWVMPSWPRLKGLLRFSLVHPLKRGRFYYLIDVKRYAAGNPVSVELVRSVYGVAESASSSRPGRILHGGIITSSRFTSEAKTFKQTVRRRPLLKDGEWLRTELPKFAPRLRA